MVILLVLNVVIFSLGVYYLLGWLNTPDKVAEWRKNNPYKSKLLRLWFGLTLLSTPCYYYREVLSW